MAELIVGSIPPEFHPFFVVPLPCSRSRFEFDIKHPVKNLLIFFRYATGQIYSGKLLSLIQICYGLFSLGYIFTTEAKIGKQADVLSPQQTRAADASKLPVAETPNIWVSKSSGAVQFFKAS